MMKLSGVMACRALRQKVQFRMSLRNLVALFIAHFDGQVLDRENQIRSYGLAMLAWIAEQRGHRLNWLAERLSVRPDDLVGRVKTLYDELQCKVDGSPTSTSIKYAVTNFVTFAEL